MGGLKILTFREGDSGKVKEKHMKDILNHFVEH